ncbi:MAG: tetratricopeptide repeat protein [Polyangiaceae bacterium]|nr:tetratricopeptide repeat protein [Polyangiaceae bacterium]
MTRGLLLGLCLCAGAALVPRHARAQPAQPAAAPAEAPEVLNEQAHSLYAEGRYDEAIAKLEAAVRLDPGGRELHYNLGLIYEIVGKADAALASYERSLALETAPLDRDHLKRTIERLRRSKRVAAESAAALRVAPALPPVAPPRECLGCDWLIGLGAAAGMGLGTGLVFAAAAAAVDPGEAVTTSATFSLTEARRRARTAHRLGVAADVSFALGGAAAAGLAVAAAVLLPDLLPAGVDAGGASDGARPTVRLLVGAAAGGAEVRW